MPASTFRPRSYKASNYNDRMPVVRYVALAALVVWLGATTAALAGDLVRHVSVVSAVCGLLILVALLVMKLVGPPPRAFPARIALVIVMLALAAEAHLRGRSEGTLLATAAIGFVLLAWYARE